MPTEIEQVPKLREDELSDIYSVSRTHPYAVLCRRLRIKSWLIFSVTACECGLALTPRDAHDVFRGAGTLG